MLNTPDVNAHFFLAADIFLDPNSQSAQSGVGDSTAFNPANDGAASELNGHNEADTLADLKEIEVMRFGTEKRMMDTREWLNRERWKWCHQEPCMPFHPFHR